MDLSALAPLYQSEGPFATVYVDTPSAVENAASMIQVRRKNLARELVGLDEETRAAIDGALDGARAPGGSTRVLVAAHGGVAIDAELPDPPIGDRATVAALPDLFPLIASWSAWVPYVLVLADRSGADILGYTAGPDPSERAVSAAGAPWPAHKTGHGGWAQARYDASVEESWEREAKDVAGQIATMADNVAARVVVGSGDERILGLVRGHLPKQVAARFTTVPGGGRHQDGNEEELARRVRAEVARAVAEDEVALLDRFAQAVGRGDAGRSGLARVVEALQLGEVDTLVVTDELERSSRELAFGPAPTDIALDDAQLRATGIAQPEHGRAVDVVLRAAIGTGAQVAVVAGGGDQAPRDGVGALLRFDVAA